MFAKFSNSKDGGELINFVPDNAGHIHHVEATKNAVIIQLIEAPQEDGTMQYRRIISIECKDAEALPALRKEAAQIVR